MDLRVATAILRTVNGNKYRLRIEQLENCSERHRLLCENGVVAVRVIRETVSPAFLQRSLANAAYERFRQGCAHFLLYPMNETPINHATRIAGAILTGGKSTRMGKPKALLILPDGKTMVDHVAQALSDAGLPVVGVGYIPHLTKLEPVGFKILPDLIPEAGPLGGIATILQSGIADGYIILGCDQPLITSEIILQLMKGETGRMRFLQNNRGESFAPFPGYFPASFAQIAMSMAKSDRRSVRNLINGNPTDWITASNEQLLRCRSINTPEEYAALLV